MVLDPNKVTICTGKLAIYHSCSTRTYLNLTTFPEWFRKRLEKEGRSEEFDQVWFNKAVNKACCSARGSNSKKKPQQKGKKSSNASDEDSVVSDLEN
jgi:hypothetical protein